jgi:hypothetical protein
MLLGLVAFNKKTQKTPDRHIALAEDRLKDWRSRRRAFEEGGYFVVNSNLAVTRYTRRDIP